MNKITVIDNANKTLNKMLNLLDELSVQAKQVEDKEITIFLCDYIVEVSKSNKKLIDNLFLKLKEYIEKANIDNDFNKLIKPLEDELDNEF